MNNTCRASAERNTSRISDRLHDLAAWRSSLESKWNEGHIYVDSIDEIPSLARECIDVAYKLSAEEVAIERKLTMEEICAFARCVPPEG